MRRAYVQSSICACAGISGSEASSAAIVVIMIGRRRSKQAWRIDSSGERCCSRSAWMAKSAIMMPFFLTIPINGMMPISANDGKIKVKGEQHQQRADTRRGQRGQDRQRVNVTLVEHAQDDVDGDQSCQNQVRLALERGLKRLRRALKGAQDRARHADVVDLL